MCLQSSNGGYVGIGTLNPTSRHSIQGFSSTEKRLDIMTNRLKETIRAGVMSALILF